MVKFRLSARLEVRGEVGVAGVDAGVDDADGDATAGGPAVGAVGGGADHLHVPLQVGQRLLTARAAPVPGSACQARCPGSRRLLDDRQAVRGDQVVLAGLGGADGVVLGRALDPGLAFDLLEEALVGRDQDQAHALVGVDDGAAGLGDRGEARLGCGGVDRHHELVPAVLLFGRGRVCGRRSHDRCRRQQADPQAGNRQR